MDAVTLCQWECDSPDCPGFTETALATAWWVGAAAFVLVAPFAFLPGFCSLHCP